MAEQQNSMFQQKYQMIINQASVREVMEEYGLKIVKKGKDFKTVCPFHDDHDPSLSIRDDKIWKCFVCMKVEMQFLLFRSMKTKY